jgi:hypothetical protein
MQISLYTLDMQINTLTYHSNWIELRLEIFAL